MATLGETVDFLGRCVGAVLREQEGDAFFELEEQIRLETKRLREENSDSSAMQRQLSSVSLDEAEKLVRAFSTYFLLINLAEEHSRVQRALDPGTNKRKEGFEQALLAVKARGYTAESAEQLIKSVDLGLTFTAHPTEMRRRTIRDHLERVFDLLEHANARGDEITAHVEALWTTPWLRRRQPTVRDEANGGLGYLDVIASVLPKLERDLEASFAAVFGQKASLRLALSLHSWIGGDRDGNPNVTPAVTEEIFELHEKLADKAMRSELDVAYARLSQSPDGEDEPFRKVLREIQSLLGKRDAESINARIKHLNAQLAEGRQLRTLDVLARPLSVRARVFGLHLASLDLREHSAVTGAAVGELLTRSGVQGYVELQEPAKIEVLLRELTTSRPLLAVGEAAPPVVEKVVAPLRAARVATGKVGPRAFGHYVVSMSEQASDLLEVLLLAREAGVDALPVPLFETLEDLERAPRVMKEVLALPAYRSRLGQRTQEVMIGYSDSNKDGGFCAANWALHEAQRQLAVVFAEAGVPYRFFHGRGTSIGRGGGSMVRGLLGQPAGTLGHGMRVTEQGEALQDKYSHVALAYRNLEQAFYGLLVSASAPKQAIEPRWLQGMARASEASLREYRSLVNDGGFIPFFEAVTPIREISRLRIASRPVRRPGPAQLSNLRAIPWVMSWTQCRAVIPGWYGLDVGLGALGQELARELYSEWSFFRSMLDNAQMALAKSDMRVFRAYRELAVDDRLGAQIEARYYATVKSVEEVTGNTLLASEPRLLRSISLRNPYIEPIHRLQVEMLQRARKVSSDVELPSELEKALLMSLHGISAGMRNTG